MRFFGLPVPTIPRGFSRVRIDDGRDLNGGGLTIEELPASEDHYSSGRESVFHGDPEAARWVPLEDAVRTMAVIDAVFLAAETGRRQSPRGRAARGECDGLKAPRFGAIVMMTVIGVIPAAALTLRCG